MKKILLIILFLSSFIFYSQETDSLSIYKFYKVNEEVSYGYKKPRILDMVRYLPKDLIEFGKFTLQKENLKWDALVVGTTLVTIPFDQQITDESNKVGHKIGGWGEDSHYKRVAGIEFLPTSVSSSVYYLGNGNTTLLLSGFFYTIGKINHNDYRALNTSNELVEVLLSVGATTQIIKRITGRQSPTAATSPGGDWNPFPSFPAYQTHTPNYDAMPSGHMATFMATLMVIATNYPEYKWIKPVGYSLGGLLAFNMVSQQVHWASDYPLGILIGYVIGKNIANRRIVKKVAVTEGTPLKTTYKTSFNYNRIYNMSAIGATITF
ncbi:phosphatase PAP2 family protein [Flavobacterium sp.]|uniref:phosphatase PAP2 family protein n=1 Tax=Flavobacterium sp. TaxID=239 RepID=UPI003C641F02